MSCVYCTHWVFPKDWDYRNKRNKPGQCSFNPVWVETASNHFCGQMTLGNETRYGSDTTESKVDMYARLNSEHVRQRDYAIAERKRHEKAAKELRLQLKALKAEQNKK